ncbi:MAG: RNA polymerase sigma-70 factor [Chitinophagaceae bacterium]|nr:MAG: RNA polymerase sigma-70 factor [Chitinophagaceae bacterium]
MGGKATTDYNELRGELCAGSHKALKALYDGLGSQLYQFSFSIVHQREVAQEVVQDVFIQVWNNRHKLTPDGNFRLYLFVATRNTSISHLRKNNRHRSFSLDEIKLPFLKIDMDAEDRLVNNDLLHRVNLAINNLPQQCRLIFKMVKQDGFKYREVAELLELTPKTVENQVGIALKKLHAAFPPASSEQSPSHPLPQSKTL